MSVIRTAMFAAAVMQSAYGIAAERGLEPPSAPATSASAASDSAALGRLFYTPAQRAALDEMRRRPPRVATQEDKTPLPPTPEYVTLNGIVRRSDGATTVWLNDKQVRGRETQEGIEIAPPRRGAAPNGVTVRVPQTGRTVDLKVGQQLEMNSGEVKEGYRAPQRAMTEKLAESPSNIGTPTRDASPPAAPARRPDRQRELLRDLLDEMTRPQTGGTASSSPDNKGEPSP